MQFFQVQSKKLQINTVGIFGVVALAFLVAFMYAFGYETPIFEAPYLALALQFVFVLGIGIAVVVVSSKAYLRSGSINILLIGCAILVSSLASTVSVWTLSPYVPPTLTANEAVTIGNIGLLLSSFGLFLSAFFTWRMIRPTEIARRKTILIMALSISAFLVLIISLASDFALLPIFLTSSGPTSLRLGVLSLSAMFYFASCTILAWKYLHSKSRIIFWYSLALALLGIALVAGVLTLHLGSGLNWASRIALYLSGIYLLLALLSPEAKRADEGISGKWIEAFRADRNQIDFFFSKLSEGFAYCKIIGHKNEQWTDFIYLDVNDAFLKIVGKTRENVVGKRNSEVNPEIYKDSAGLNVLRVYAKVAETGESVRFERYSKFVGKWLNILVYSPMKGYFAELNEDITEKKKAETAQREYQDRLKLAQRIAHLGSWEFHVKEDKALWSEELFEIFHLKPQTYGPNTEDYRKFIHPDDDEAVNKAMTKLFSEGHLGDVTGFDYRIILDDQSLRVLHTERMVIEVDGTGRVSKIIGIEQDITERKLIEQQLERQTKHLEELVEERTKQLKDSERLATIGATAGMVGHDIRNPLQAIMSDAYLLKGELTSNMAEGKIKEAVTESLQSIEENIEYINKIVQDLQDYARPLTPTTKKIELDQVCKEVIVKKAIPQNIQASCTIEETAKEVVADSAILKRILANLVNNAVQAMPQGGELSVHAREEASEIVITVQDTGGGIPEEFRAKLFTPLFTTKSKGQGFGLAVVKRLTEALGGTVMFESQEGKGTVFIVRLPQSPTKS
jgi:signal transduction histidine kinase